MSKYVPPYKTTPAIIDLVAQISEQIGVLKAVSDMQSVPNLRRGNRIKTIQASLAIEGNTLDLEQVTAVISGKRVLAQPREIQEVRNAFAAYDELSSYSACSCEDLLKAHSLLMAGLVGEPGKFRTGSVGIQRGNEMVHVAPPAGRVAGLVNDLLRWLADTEEHPLIASCIFHYEFEFIHPFQDGNGRIGRLWQTLILSQWRPIMALLPVESVVRDRQQEYYAALSIADQAADATVFIEFMLKAILKAIQEIENSAPQVTPQVTPQVMSLLKVLKNEMSRQEILEALKLKDRKSLRIRYLVPAIQQNLIEMTNPDKPNSRFQKYRLTTKGNSWKRKKV
jgi:Fic family protein